MAIDLGYVKITNDDGGLCGGEAGSSGGNSGGIVSFTNCSNNGENKKPESNGQILGSLAAIENGFCSLIQTKGNNNQNITEYLAVELNEGDYAKKSNPENIQLVFRK